MEVGRAYFETPKKRYTILDAPGHKVGGQGIVLQCKTGATVQQQLMCRHQQ